MKKRELRSGYTTGACAAAAAKAAAQLLVVAYRDTPARIADAEVAWHAMPLQVSIPFPDGSRHIFNIHNSGYEEKEQKAFASVIKNAGDDPDVTNGAEIIAEAAMVLEPEGTEHLIIRGGRGVGRMTKPGLAIPVGEPAINPVPRRMIREAVKEAILEVGTNGRPPLKDFPPHNLAIEITISVKDGELLAKRTLNERLGIVGGLSILGTTGIVRPLSAEAWTATITSSMDVAVAMGRSEIVLSAGRTSERAHMRGRGFPEDSYVMMGDYLEFSLREAARRFSRIDLCAQWAKMLKIAMAAPQTHVRHGAIDVGKTVDFLIGMGIKMPENAEFNTAREMFDYLTAGPADHRAALTKVCNAAKSYASGIADPVPVSAVLVDYDGEIIEYSS